MATRVSRRRFLKASASSAMTFTILRSGAFAYAANEKLDVGIVGIAGQGNYNLREVHAAGGNVVALCDVHESRDQVKENRKAFGKAAFFVDFRRMLADAKLDAVLVATPDHTHAPVAAAALIAGKHVYCEKPLTHTVHEARLLATLAAKHKRVTQMGTQIHAGANYRRVVEVIQSGAIGDVKEVHVWVAKSWGGGDRPKDRPGTPAGLDWELWLGPAPARDYHSGLVPQDWRRFWDFGGGTLADMMCHHADLPFWALNLRHPNKVTAEGPPPHAEGAAEWTIVHYDFPARGKLPPVQLHWYDGGKRPRHFADGLLPKWGDGTLFVGAKGMLIAGYTQFRLLPERDFGTFVPPTPKIPNSIGHHKEWIEACKTSGQTTCNFDYSGALTEAVLLGVAAYRLGKPITWDAITLKAVGDSSADRFLRKEYRKGWEL
jgi:predicted dehydrogenase